MTACLLMAMACAGQARAGAAPERRTIVFTGVTVVDVEQGRTLRSRTVVIDAGRIAAIGRQGRVRIPAGAHRIDGRGRFLIPGLVDMHVHLFNRATRRPPNDWMFPRFVANGVTAVREMNADAGSVAQVRRWRDGFDHGDLVAPRILAAGIAVRGDSPEDAARRVDAAADAGADFIKVFSDVPDANWRAILDAARHRRLTVAGHVPATVPLLNAAKAGQRSSEHLMQAYEACSSIEAAVLDARREPGGDEDEARILAAFDPVRCRSVARRLATTGQCVVPTLVLANADSLAAGAPPDTDPRWPALRSDEQTRWRRILAGYTAHDAALAASRWPVARRIVAMLQRAGVPVLTGTDAPMPGVYPGDAVHDEMAMLVAAGLSPQEALRAATLRPAECLGIAAGSGSVAPGKRADLVLLDADPTQDIGNTRRIHAVVLDGRLFDRDALDLLLAAPADVSAPAGLPAGTDVHR